MFSPTAGSDQGQAFDLLLGEQIRLHDRAVRECDRRAPVVARMSLEPVETLERLVVDLVHFAGDGLLPIADHPGIRPEVAEIERGHGPRLADKLCIPKEWMVWLARKERSV